MAKLPGVADLGATPVAAAARPVATVTGLGRAGSALAEGGRQLGAGIAKAGEGIADYDVAQTRWDYAKAHSDFVTRKMDLDEATRTDSNYGPDENGKALPQRYQEKITDLQSQAAALIQSGPMRDRFVMDTRPVAEQGFIAAQQHARSEENDASIAYVTKQGNAIMDRAVKAPDDASRRLLIDSHSQLVDGLLEKNAITEVQAVAMRQAWAHQYATADLLARADTDPQGVINELRAKPGSPDQVVNRIAQIEGTTKNAKSSATGTGQFIDSTWLDVLKRNRPDLAQGKSDSELLDLRADKQLGLQMTAAYVKENSAFLRGQGLPVTPGNTYLAHFLGPAGAAAVLKGDPNKPVLDVLAKELGPDKAKKMVEANPKVLGGQLTGSVRQWANAEMGGSAADQGSIYDMLRPDVREQVLSQAMAKQHAHVADDLSGFKAKVDDTTTEAMRTGNVTTPLQRTDFIRSLGAEAGPKQYASYAANLELGKHIQQVSALDPEEQRALVASYAPKPGEGFAEQSQRQDMIAKAVKASNAERDKDPAAFAIARLPVVKEAYQNFTSVLSDATADDDARRAAARDYATKIMMEQQRIGVPPEARAVLPKGYVEALKAKLESPQESGGTANVVGRIKSEAQLWGDSWPQVYRQIAPEVGPVVRVIGSGVSDQSARILTELAPQKLSDILKDESTEKSNQVKKDVLTAFTPFIKSMAGNEGGIALFNDFRAQGEKLSAYYIVNGMTSADASAKAFKELIGDRYEFRDSWRAPKNLPQPIDDIQRGSVQAMRDLEAIGIAPPRDTVGGLSPEYLVRAKADAIRRDGKWVTAPDESGLALVYNDEAVRRGDGKPLILPWSQLAALAERGKRQWSAMYDTPVGGGVLPAPVTP